MSLVFQEIQSITRPKTLMTAAKEVVKAQQWRERKLNERELKTLLDEEMSQEHARIARNGQYSVEAHVALLARLINQTLLAQSH